MPITCTFKDLDKLRDSANGRGPIGKLADAGNLSLVDKFRVARLLKAVDSELAVYGRFLIELGKKFGDPVVINGTESYQIRQESYAAYLAAKKELDNETCEVSANPLPASVYSNVAALTGQDLMNLECFIVQPPLADTDLDTNVVPIKPNP